MFLLLSKPRSFQFSLCNSVSFRGVCVCVRVSVSVCMRTHASACGDQKSNSGVVPHALPTLFVETESVTGWEVTD